MKQREFDALRGPEAVRFSGGQFRLAVESLDNPRRDTAQGEKPVEDQVPMTPQALRDLLHRREPAPHGLSAPGIEELPRPSRGCILPEPLELFAQQVSPKSYCQELCSAGLNQAAFCRTPSVKILPSRTRTSW